MSRLPNVGGDDNTWGNVLNDFLAQEHNADGTLKQSAAIAAKYTKPSGGIPASDLDATTQTRVTNAVQKGELVLNVKDYGAKGDGVTDDTAAIQAALDAAATAGGGIVFFPTGSYYVEPLNVPSNVIVAGTGPGSIVKLRPQASGTQFAPFQPFGTSGAHKTNIHFRDLVVDGNKTAHGTAPFTDQDGINFKYVDGGSVKGCIIRNVVADGIDLDDATGIELSGNTSYNNGGSGIHVSDGSTGCRVIGNSCYSNGATFSRAGIGDFSNAADNVFVGNDCHDNYSNYDLVGFRERFSSSNLSYGTVTAADNLFGMGDAQYLVAQGGPYIFLVRSGDWIPKVPTPTSVQHSAGVMTFFPFLVPKPLALSQVRCRVTAAVANSTVKLAIYRAGGDGFPSDLRHDLTGASPIDASTTGDKSVSGTWNLRAGLHWFAAVAQGGAPTMRSANGLLPVMVGAPSGDEALNATLALAPTLTQSGVTGDFPATAASAAALGRNSGPIAVVALVA